MCSSTSYLLSKCGMPVCRLAEPAELKTRCTPAAFAASAAEMPLSRLGSCASLQGRRHRKEGARSFERLRERCRVFERRADECDARGCEVPRPCGLGIARDGANLVTALEQAFHHRATLFARASGDDDGKLLTHDLPPFTS